MKQHNSPMALGGGYWFVRTAERPVFVEMVADLNAHAHSRLIERGRSVKLCAVHKRRCGGSSQNTAS
jgi:hypothetical protein